MRVSLNVTQYAPADDTGTLADHLTRTAVAADQGGLHTVWVADHLLQCEPGVDPAAPMLEAATTLGFVAARTGRIKLGTMVSAATYRPAALLVKAVTTLDVLSGGRAWLGVGAGYQQAEADAMGLPLPDVATRYDALLDTLTLARRMWSGDEAAYRGRTVTATGPVAVPRPLTAPHPPVLVGGTGERRTLRLVAELADACNLFDLPDDGATIRHKLDVLRSHCDDLGRPFDEIERTVSTRLLDDESEHDAVARLGMLAAYGIQHAVVLAPGPWNGRRVERLSRVAAAVG